MTNKETLTLALAALTQVVNLVADSRGVAGLHLNGDEAPWDELEKGGAYERLQDLHAAMDAIKEELAKPPAKPVGQAGGAGSVHWFDGHPKRGLYLYAIPNPDTDLVQIAWQNKWVPHEFYELEQLDPLWYNEFRPLYGVINPDETPEDSP